MPTIKNVNLIIGTSSQIIPGTSPAVHPQFFQVSFDVDFSKEEILWTAGLILDIIVVRVIDDPDDIDFGFKELRLTQHHGAADSLLTPTKIFNGIIVPTSSSMNITKSNTIALGTLPPGDLRCKAVVGMFPNTGNVLPAMNQSQEVRIDIPAF